MRIEKWLYAAPLRLKSLFRRRQVEQDLDDELQYHLEHKIEDGIARGMSPEEARRTALLAMDGLTLRKEECRDARSVNLIDHTIQDVRYALRVLAKSPGFTFVAILTLALAIGANAVVFAVLNTLILRPIDVPRAESLLGIEQGNQRSMYLSYPDYLDLRDRNRSFEDLAAFSIALGGLDAGDNPARAWLVEASGNYFDALGIQPYLGRFFHQSDEKGPNSAPYIVLSYGYWQSHFQSDRGVIGRVVRLNKHPFTVIGVAPADFHGTVLFFSPDFWVPMVNQEQIEGRNTLNQRGTHSVFMALGHLKAGVTSQQAVSDLNSIGAYLDATHPKDHTTTTFRLARPELYGNFIGQPAKAFMTGLMILAALILVGACANLGSLFSARAADRSREVALRLALGAGRVRILRQLLTEAVLLSIAGGAAGLWASILLLGGLNAWQPFPRFPIHLPVTPDANVYLLALALALASGLLFGIVPARQVLRADPYQVVKAGPSGTIGRRLTLRDMLLVAQIAICAVLVTASMVAVRGLSRSLGSDFGFDPGNALLVDTDVSIAGYRGDQAAAVQQRMIRAVEMIPGVESAAFVSRPPLSEDSSTTLIYDDRTADLRQANAVLNAERFTISPDYLEAAKTKLVEGRALSYHDDAAAPRVALVNSEFAKRVFGAPSKAVGGHFKLRTGTRVRVVGVVEDGKYRNLMEDRRAAVFLSLLQSPQGGTWLVVRSQRAQEQVATASRNEIRSVDAGIPIYVQTWQKQLESALLPARLAAFSLGVMGILGAMLAVTGTFGMAAYSVSKRVRELGIRIALGASRADVLHAALGHAFRLLAIGSAAGLILGVMASRILGSIVYAATPRDPVVLSGVVGALLLLGLLATWIPAQRALSLNPVKLLREE